jgi:hypothetical protein
MRFLVDSLRIYFQWKLARRKSTPARGKTALVEYSLPSKQGLSHISSMGNYIIVFIFHISKTNLIFFWKILESYKVDSRKLPSIFDAAKELRTRIVGGTLFLKTREPPSACKSGPLHSASRKSTATRTCDTSPSPSPTRRQRKYFVYDVLFPVSRVHTIRR